MSHFTVFIGRLRYDDLTTIAVGTLPQRCCASARNGSFGLLFDAAFPDFSYAVVAEVVPVSAIGVHSYVCTRVCSCRPFDERRR